MDSIRKATLPFAALMAVALAAAPIVCADETEQGGFPISRGEGDRYAAQSAVEPLAEPPSAAPSAHGMPARAKPPTMGAEPRQKALPLLPPDPAGGAQRGSASPLSSLVGVLSSLAIVLGLFYAVTWVLRRGMPRGAASLPREVVEVLGRAPLAGRQQVHVVRFGSKLLLVALTPGGVQTLSEIADPAEADRVAAACQPIPAASGAGFRQVLQQFNKSTSAAVSTRSPRQDSLDFSGLAGLPAKGEPGRA